MDLKRAATGKTGAKLQRLTNPRRRGNARSRPSGAPLTVFVHIPKTAGTTFMAVLRDCFPGGVGSVGNSFKANGGFDTGPMGRLRDAPVERTRNMHVLAGHLPFAIREVLPEGTRFVTFLRDPVERTLSQYYGLLKLSRRKELPGDGSFEAVIAEGGIIYDNLQTRMLANDPEPMGEIDEEALEQAKENLRNEFAAFGVVERFDESLVLIKQALGLRSITYVQQRVTHARPRGAEVPEEALRLAREINNYDAELYTWAREFLDHKIAEQGLEFAADVAALDVSRTGAAPPPPPAAEPAALWDLLVRTRAELFADRRERLQAAIQGRSETRDLLLSFHQELRELKKIVTPRPPAPPAQATRAQSEAKREATQAGDGAEGGEEPVSAEKKGARGQKRGSQGAAQPPAEVEAPPVEGEAPSAARSSERAQKHDRLATRAAEVTVLRDEAAARLAEVEGRLEAVEGSEGGGSIELERLRRESAQLGKRVTQLTNRAAQLQKRVETPGSDEKRAADKRKRAADKRKSTLSSTRTTHHPAADG